MGVETIRKIDFGEMSRQHLKSQSTSTTNVRRNQSTDSLDEAPIMSTSMRSPPVARKIQHAPVQVPGFHRGSFTIPANNMSQSSSSTGLRNRVLSEQPRPSEQTRSDQQNNLNSNNSIIERSESRSDNRNLFHIESESEVGTASQRFSNK